MLLAALVGCSGTPAPQMPFVLEQVAAVDKDARRAVKERNFERAHHRFVRLLKLQQSLDDISGAAMTMLNLAAVSHQLHDDEAALIWLDTILEEKTRIYSSNSRLIAALRKAIILTDGERISEAASALKLAESLCAQRCASKFGIEILRARLLLLNGDAKGALITALKISKQIESDKSERANTFRVAALAAETLEQYPNAMQYYQSALAIDKAMGLSLRISDDLHGMARVAKKLGLNSDAEIYLRRGDLVNEAQRKLHE